MILDSELMKKCEKESGYTSLQLMEIVADQLYEALKELCKNRSILIICGKGNNGGDGLALAKLFYENEHDVSVYAFHHGYKTPESKYYRKKLPKSLFIDELKDADIIIDAIYGFSFKGKIKEKEKAFFQRINELNGYKISIDINSGADCDLCTYEECTFRSDLTLALGAYKPIHLLKKSHHLFKECKLISLPVPDMHSSYLEMNEETFIHNYPFMMEDGYKGITGKTCIIGGSYGMAGAAMLNLMGAKSFGCTYIHCGCDHSIYPILSGKLNTIVYHPFDGNSYKDMNFNGIDSISFGSGCNNLTYDRDLMRIIATSNKKVVLDAHAFDILSGNRYLLKFCSSGMVLTPHIKEFSSLMGKSIDEVKKHKMELGKAFVKEYDVILVLKDVNTIVFYPDGDIYINTIGNAGLAKAGSGDVLTGILAASLALVKDTKMAVMMGVWFHSTIADMMLETNSITCFDLDDYIVYANKFFRKIESESCKL